eukprot:scaffold5393_cov35-Prasinocladus_malaysianus.AAC.2
MIAICRAYDDDAHIFKMSALLNFPECTHFGCTRRRSLVDNTHARSFGTHISCGARRRALMSCQVIDEYFRPPLEMMPNFGQNRFRRFGSPSQVSESQVQNFNRVARRNLWYEYSYGVPLGRACLLLGLSCRRYATTQLLCQYSFLASSDSTLCTIMPPQTADKKASSAVLRPSQAIDDQGSLDPNRCAYVTFLNGELRGYVQGAIAIARALRKHGSAFPLVVAAAPTVPRKLMKEVEAESNSKRLYVFIIRRFSVHSFDGGEFNRDRYYFMISFATLCHFIYRE